jgi:DNA-binding response OmpR family regulator
MVKTVLVVEDDVSILKLTGQLLYERGYTVFTIAIVHIFL